MAVSGGADSLALWRLAAAFGAERGFRVEAAHIDHGLRDSSPAEAARVRALASVLATPCHALAVRVRDRGGGPEADAREVRHLALEQIRTRRQLGQVVLGHSADDQAETVLMRLLSGAGIRGLAAMQPLAGALLRPLLEFRRAELAALAAGLGVEPVDDPSNRDRRLLRPRLRHDLLPSLAAHFGDPVEALCALAREAALAEELVQRELVDLPPELQADGSALGSRPQLAALPAALRTRWLLSAMDSVGRRPRRARDSLERFARLLPGTRPFSLDLHRARVEVGSLEVRVIPLARSAR